MSNREPVVDYILLNADVRSMLAQQDMDRLSQAVADPASAAELDTLLDRVVRERTGLDASVLQTVLAAAEDFSQTLASALSPEQLQQVNTAVELSLQDADFYRRLHQDMETALRDQLGLSEEAIGQLDALAKGPHGPQPGPRHMTTPPWWDVLDYYVQVNRELRPQVTAEELAHLDNLVEQALQDPDFLNSLSENPATVLQENGISQDLIDRINTVVEDQRRRRFSEHLAGINHGSPDPQ